MQERPSRTRSASESNTSPVPAAATVERALALAKKVGYQSVANSSAHSNSPSTNRFSLGRVAIMRDIDLFTFSQICSGTRFVENETKRVNSGSGEKSAGQRVVRPRPQPSSRIALASDLSRYFPSFHWTSLHRQSPDRIRVLRTPVSYQVKSLRYLCLIGSAHYSHIQGLERISPPNSRYEARC